MQFIIRFLKKLWVILYKNLLLRRTQWFMSTLELLLPIALVAIACWKEPSEICVDNGKGEVRDFSTNDFQFQPSNGIDCGSRQLSYAPANSKTKEVTEKVNAKCRYSLTIQERDNETIFEKELINATDDEVGLVYPDDFETLLAGNVENKVISYKIRMHSNISNLPSTEKLLPTQKLGDKDFALVGPNLEHGEKYLQSNFGSLQYAIDKVLIEMITGQTFDTDITVQPSSYYLLPFEPSRAGSAKGVVIAQLLLSFGVMFMVPTITRNVVSEKQTGITELLKSTGVSGGIQWLGWMINSLVPLLFSISICTLLFFSRLADPPDDMLPGSIPSSWRPGGVPCEPEAYFAHADWTLVWVILLLYILATIALCFFICSVVKKPTIATTIALVICVASSFLYLVAGNQVALLVFPNCALAYAFMLISRLDLAVLDDSDRPYGAHWDWECMNYAFPESRGHEIRLPINLDVYQVSLMQIIGMLIADIIVYSLLALYLENVLPSEHGVRRPWYLFNFKEMFKSQGKRRPVQIATQTPVEMGMEVDKQEDSKGEGAGEGAEGTSVKEKVSSAGTDVEGPTKSEPDQETVANSSFEPETGKNIGVQVQNMYKNFGRKMAVNGVSLSMYTGDIFALLGHNGAGKTTLISMITGFFSPTRGTAIVDGHDIQNDLAKAREHMGLCPQHNMIFDNIPVINQLIIFGMLRGMPSQYAKMEGEYLLFKMNLIDKKSTLAKKLSGGQKRKLCLAMALIGGTKVVILDEPTSGMDPQARREIWDLLLELRGERTILLTTHFMEEADVLGDRIGIMAAGKLQCIGTTAYLKKYYGTGLNLKLTLKQQELSPEESKPEASEGPEASKKILENPNVPKIVDIVEKHISGASVQKDARSVENRSEVFMRLPAEKATTAALTKMFTDLSRSKDNLGIQTIGLQQTTMDEVFLRVGELAEEEERGPTQNYVWTEDDFGKAPKIVGMKKIVWQFIALLRKKWILFKRKWLILLLEASIPLLLILAALFILQKEEAEMSRPPTPYEPQGPQGPPGPFQPPSPPAQGPSNYTPGSGPQPSLLISLEKYASPISYYYASEDPNLTSHIRAVLGSSAKEYNDAPNDFNYGLAEIGKLDMKKYKRHLIIAVKASVRNSRTEITTFFNAYPYHSAPLALNTATNIALRAMNPAGNNKIQVVNHPWIRPPKSLNSFSRQGPNYQNYNGGGYQEIDRCEYFSYTLRDTGGAIMLLLAFILFLTTFIVGPVEEKITNVKQLQLMTGLQPASYWLAHFVWDYTLYFLFVILTLILVAIVELSGKEYLIVNHGAGALFLILMCYGFSFLVLNYLVSLRSTTVAGGFALVTTIHLLTGTILGFLVLALTEEDSGLYYYINLMVKVLGYFFPSMPALLALVKFIYMAGVNKGCGKEGAMQCCSYFLWSGYNKQKDEVPGVGQELFFVMLLGVVYVVLLVLIEYKIFRMICGRETPPPFPPNIYDDDVYQEAERVNTLVHSGQVGTECMVVQNLSKAYRGFAAVSQVNFDVHYGECFGLLGVNGAGKTTVFKMITGEEIPSEGIVYGFGTTTEQKPRFFFSNIGYCPQFDAIFVVFTGREMLELFGVLRGLPYRGAKMEATKWLQRFGLIESANARCGNYSGGMKRRLSTAMAMIGDPALLLLDEPTSGVDPVSRHQFWGILEKIRDSGQSIILTSHSMDECEALCSRLGIMVNGQFQCFGGVQHLKSKFAQGYSLLIKLKPDLAFGTPEIDEKVTKFQEKINETFQPCSLKDRHENLLQYHLENPAISWDDLFKTLEKIKTEFEDMIEDYSVNETSLEEVFLAFARSQYGERRVEVTTCAQICTCSC